MSLMEIQNTAHWDISYSVAIRKHKCLIVYMWLDPFYPSACHGINPCIYQRYFPRLGMRIMNFYRVVGEVDRHIGFMKEIIRKIFLDVITLVSQADHEVI